MRTRAHAHAHTNVHERTHSHADTGTGTGTAHNAARDAPQERSGEVELTRPWSYQDFREALLEDFVREVVLPCAAEAAEVERQRSGIPRV